MRMIQELETAMKDVTLGYMDENDEWATIEGEDGEENIKKLLKRKDAQEVILHMSLDYVMQMREALTKDLSELYERSEKDASA